MLMLAASLSPLVALLLHLNPALLDACDADDRNGHQSLGGEEVGGVISGCGFVLVWITGYLFVSACSGVST